MLNVRKSSDVLAQPIAANSDNLKFNITNAASRRTVMNRNAGGPAMRGDAPVLHGGLGGSVAS